MKISQTFLIVLIATQIFATEPQLAGTKRGREVTDIEHVFVAEAEAAPVQALPPRVLMSHEINVNFFIEQGSHLGFQVHGDNHVASLMQGVHPNFMRFLATLQPWIPTHRPILLTELNTGLFENLDYALYDGNTVMQMGVFFKEHFGKADDPKPVILYFTRPYVDGEALSSDEIFRNSDELDESIFDLALRGKQSEIKKALGANPRRRINITYAAPIDRVRFWAESGIAEAQNCLATRLLNGFECEKNERDAFLWFRAAANQGHVVAQNDLGRLLRLGVGCEKDDLAAFEWFQKAATQGNRDAEYNLACDLEGGIGCAKDDAAAFEWFQKAASQGDVDAQYKVAYALDHGIGCVKDEITALEWYQKAAVQGSVDAKNNLGCFMVTGKRIEQNLPEAFKIFHELALKPDAASYIKFNYGVFVLLGICTEKKPRSGYEFDNALFKHRRPRCLILAS